MNMLKWLYPGLGVKRWLFVATIGVLFSGLGLALVMSSKLIHAITIAEFVSYLSISDNISDHIIISGGIGLVILGFFLIVAGYRLSMISIISSIIPDAEGRLIDVLYQKRSLSKGQQIVVLGGGTGLSTLLRGLKKYTSNITAIVTVADDGGSSGILRRDMGVLPPGDIRNCLVALADTENLMEDLFRYRYREGEFKGHSFGNLFIATLSEIAGDFEKAVKLSSKVLAIRGQVLPSTLSDIRLKAVFDDGSSVIGESNIPKCNKKVDRIELMPGKVAPLPEAIDAISKADAVIIGPGSLYTSVIPNLLVDGVADAIKRVRVPRIYICNVMTQPGETSGYTVSDHVKAIESNVGPGLIDYVLVNTESAPKELLDKYLRDGAEPVKLDSEHLTAYNVKVVRGDLLNPSELVRHDPDKLAAALLNLLAFEHLGRNRRII